MANLLRLLIFSFSDIFATLRKKFNKKVKSYLNEFETITRKHNPSITLCYLKIFSGKSKFLEFNDSGLGLAIHLLINKIYTIVFLLLFIP